MIALIAFKGWLVLLHFQKTTDEPEEELSPKKFQTDKLPDLQKVCDIDCSLNE